MVTEGRALGPRVSLDRWRQLAWQATSYKYGKIVRHQITVFLISKHSQRYYFLFNIWYVYVLDKSNTLWLRDTVRQTSPGKSAAGADLRSARRPRSAKMKAFAKNQVGLIP